MGKQISSLGAVCALLALGSMACANGDGGAGAQPAGGDLAAQELADSSALETAADTDDAVAAADTATADTAEIAPTADATGADADSADAAEIAAACTPADCNDKNECTDDSCQAGVCVHLPVAATTACSDNDACTLGDTCGNGVCLPGQLTNCDDASPCTSDTCSAATGCIHAAKVGDCSDGDACTINDACQDGKCQGGKNICDDGNLCTKDSCKAGGGCESKPAPAPCQDGNPCTFSDQCDSGVCMPGAVTDCTDGNACTNDSCDVTKGGCQHAANTLPCDDGDLCTLGDVCAGGQCTFGKKIPCNDGNACTADVCNKAGDCAPTNSDGAACQDGNGCTANDTCKGGVCLAGAVTDCNDGNVCTVDYCDFSKGCVNLQVPMLCDDGDVCTTNDVCKAGKCGGAAKVCDDSNPCTDDGCDNLKGCQFNANAAACDDGNACTEKDACKAKACAGTAVACNDKDGCTIDACDKISGCTKTVDPAKCEVTGKCFIGYAKDANGDCQPVVPSVVTPNRCAGIDLELDAAGAPVVGANCTNSPDYNLLSLVGGQWKPVLGPTPTEGRRRDLVRSPTDKWYLNTSLGSINAPSYSQAWSGAAWLKADQSYKTWNWAVLLVDPADPAKLHNFGLEYATDRNVVSYSTTAGGVWGAGTVIEDAGTPKSAEGFDVAFNPVTKKIDVLVGISLAPGSMRVDHLSNASGSWVSAVAASVALPGVGGAAAGGVSFGYDAAGKIHGVFVVAGLNQLYYLTDASGAWQSTLIGEASPISTNTVARMDAAGKLHVLCYDDTQKKPKYATNKYGATWVVRTLPFKVAPFGAVTGGDARMDMEMDGNGDLHIVFANHVDNTLNYFKYSPGAVSAPCKANADCSDSSGCTTGTCDKGAGTCSFVNLPDATTCDDGTACTTADACTAGKCTGKAKVCDDGNPCTDDGCDKASGCTTANNAKACSSPNGGTCSAGACICAAGKANCGGQCADTLADPQHCGSCVGACKPGDSCQAGKCVSAAVCGNGKIESGEACDDGNNGNNDGCGSLCVVETGYACNGTPSVCTPVCGDGQKVGNEECDDANIQNGDGCSSTCKVESSCKDGKVNGAETDVDCGGATCAACAPGLACGQNSDCATANCVNKVCRMPKIEVAGTLYVDLRAYDCNGSAATWPNRGSLGPFKAVGSPVFTASVSGMPIVGIAFDGTASAYEGPAMPADVIGNSDRTVEVWVLNPKVDSAEESICALGHRGATRANLSLNYGSSLGYGAVTHFSDDIGWPSKPPDILSMHHIAYVYDGNQNCTVYVDAVKVATKALGGPLVTGSDAMTLGVQRHMNDATKLAFVNEAAGTQMGFSGFIHSVRVHGGQLSASQITTNYVASASFGCAIDADCATGSCVKNVCATKAASCAGKPDGTNCDDGNACTLADNCKSGVCTGTAKSCDDGNACTTDSCDPKSGCATAPATGACDDGNGCTKGDLCANGVCVSGVGCAADATCTSAGQTQQCVCNSGYTGNGFACSDIDECATSPCLNGGTCANSPGSFACTCGSTYGGKTCELLSPTIWVKGPNLVLGPRSEHGMAQLGDGRVLIAGGLTTGAVPLDTAEVFDPKTKTMAAAANKMSGARWAMTVDRLPDGRAFVALGKGAGDVLVKNAHIFDPKTNQFDAGTALTQGRIEHTMTMLDDGRVLIAGGSDGTNALATADIVDPKANTVTTISIGDARTTHVAVKLNSGKVLLCSGWNGTAYVTSGVVFDPATNSVSPVTGAFANRKAPHAFLLGSGKVMVILGSGPGKADLYDPGTNSVALTATAMADGNNSFAGAGRLTNSGLFVAGGRLGNTDLDISYYYDPVAGFASGPKLPFAIRATNVRPLVNGTGLMVGGSSGAGGAPLAQSWVFNPATKALTQTSTSMSLARGNNFPILNLTDGRLFVAGGFANPTYYANTDLFTTTCDDGKLNGAETDIDCGGGICPNCGSGKACTNNADCGSGNCSPTGVCVLKSACGDMSGLQANAPYPMSGICLTQISVAKAVGPHNPTAAKIAQLTPTVNGGFDSTAVIGANGNLYMAGADKVVYAVKPDGSLAWKFSTPSSSYQVTPALAADGTLYIGTNGGTLHAINTATGLEKWKFTSAASDPFRASPVVGPNGVVYLGCDDGKFYAVKPDGSKAWSYATGGPFIHAAAAIAADGTLIVGSYDKKVHAVNADGTAKWQFTTGSQITSPPILDSDGTIYVAPGDGKVYRINPDGTAKGTPWPGSSSGALALLQDGKLVNATGDSNVFAYLPDGTVAWQAKLAGGVQPVGAPVIGADGVIYVATGYGSIHAFNPNTGVQKWTLKPAGQIDANVAMGSDGALWFGDGLGALYAIRDASGCANLTKDGTESDTDCGGSACKPCAVGKACGAAADCQSGVCSAKCLAPKCGDGVVQAFEACDDGNTTAGDGCSAACAVEATFACKGSPSVCALATKCTVNPCKNGGTCEGDVNTYTCTCTENFGGANCDKNVMGMFAPGPQLKTTRTQQNMVLLADGRVLAVGGLGAGNIPLGGADILDPASDSVTASGNGMSPTRSGMQSALVKDGRVVVAFGATAGNVMANNLYVFDPATGKFDAGTAGSGRVFHTVTALADGRALIVGGSSNTAGTAPLGDALVFDPATLALKSVATGTPRRSHLALRLATGKVLVVAGMSTVGLTNGFVFDPANDSVTAIKAVLTARSTDNQITQLKNGKVLISGGNGDNVDVYDPVADTVQVVSTGQPGRWNFSATLLKDGRVLFAGGVLNTGGAPLDSTILFDPANNTCSLGPTMPGSRRGHLAVLLDSGSVLILGGSAGATAAASNSAALFKASSGSFAMVMGTLQEARAQVYGLKLNDGRVWIAGGYNGAYLQTSDYYQ